MAPTPYAIKVLLTLVPFSVGEFESKDVIRRVEPSTIDAQDAFCVTFQTVEGDKREDGEICFDQMSGVLLRASLGPRRWTYSHFQTIASARMPGHIDYEEPSYSFHIDLAMQIVDTLLEDAFAFPKDVPVRNLCRRFSDPLPLSIPPPSVEVYAGLPETVLLRATVSREGNVLSSTVLRAPSSELGKVAMQVVSGWHYQPGTCDGVPIRYELEVTVPFGAGK